MPTSQFRLTSEGSWSVAGINYYYPVIAGVHTQYFFYCILQYTYTTFCSVTRHGTSSYVCMNVIDCILSGPEDCENVHCLFVIEELVNNWGLC